MEIRIGNAKKTLKQCKRYRVKLNLGDMRSEILPSGKGRQGGFSKTFQNPNEPEPNTLEGKS